MAEPQATNSAALERVRRTSPVPTRLKIKRLVWSVVQGTLYRGSFHTWSGWRAFWLRCFGARVGKHCTIRRTSRVYYPWLLTLGDESCLADRVEIYNLGPIEIGRSVNISQEAYLCAGTHDYRRRSFPLLTPPIRIGNNVWIGARAFIGPGVELGDGAIVAAAAVVVKNVPPWMIVGGNPARVLKPRPPLEES